MNTHPLLGFLRTLFLFLTCRVAFDRKDRNREIIMEDGKRFRIFRHVRIRTHHRAEPQAVFIVRFKPKGMSVQQNIRFSLLPMLIFMGLRGFREKYWCVNDDSGLCQGVYAWQTLEDARNYSQSIAMRFMTGRSHPDSVSFQILDQSASQYWLFGQSAARSSALHLDTQRERYVRIK